MALVIKALDENKKKNTKKKKRDPCSLKSQGKHHAPTKCFNGLELKVNVTHKPRLNNSLILAF